MSLLDRLIDDEPGARADPPTSSTASLQAARASVQRDLENLLNTKNPHFDLPAEFTEASQSVLTYGLSDLVLLDAMRDADRQRVAHAVEQAIRTFEPRLTAVSVTPLAASTDARTGRPNGVRLRVEGRLIVEPVSEPIAFDFDRPSSDREWVVRSAD
jgi:type VI secretion system lysozyme-like protein